MKNKTIGRMGLMFGMALLTLTGCRGTEFSDSTNSQTEETIAEVQKIEKEEEMDIGQAPLQDKKSLYESDEEDSVVTMYLTVRRGNSAEGTDHSWAEVNAYSAYDYEDKGIDRYQVEGLLQVGDENGPVEGELGYGAAVPNATVQIRGQTSSRNAQKNYKVRIKEDKGLWRGQQTINLNKHQTDGTRFRNKLGFDLIKGIPQMVSLRTQFVHLYVKDETDGAGDGRFEDYGLYTQVEQLNKKGLRAHGLDPNAHLYKVNSCEFYRYEDVIKKADDSSFDEKAFEARLECKGNNDHTKLIRMLEDVNDVSIPVSDLIEKHFDVENLTYWMAFHILTGNVDTQNRNFYIYSPQNSEKWYWISWDMDACLRKTENEQNAFSDMNAWERGVSNYWGNVLFQRCLKSEEFRKSLDSAILEVKEYLSEDRINGLIHTYRPVVEPYAFSMPDQYYESLTKENYNLVATSMAKEVETNYQEYLKSLESPLPFYIGVPQPQDGKLKIRWDVSYDFQSEDITYKAEVASSYDMQNVIASYEGMWPEMEMEALPVGQYFIRVRSYDTSGNEQYAFDWYETEHGKEYGIICFYVLPDGTIGEDVYEE